ncbi:MAG TPA: class I SAM-dependent methyltransferase [Candidatus Dormibacteraeota bacterium]|nr:class I SAM-dependent methyltransferase [Candidatus Dormibacteraeota bacterium]
MARIKAWLHKDGWQKPFQTLREKPANFPLTTNAPACAAELLKLSDEALLEHWAKSRAETLAAWQKFSHSGWHHVLCAEDVRGKKIMDVGPGFGVPGIGLSLRGAQLTFVDLTESNLGVLKRLCRVMGMEAQFCLLKDRDSLRSLDSEYDFIMPTALLHAPSDVIRPDYQELIRHLKVGGRWLQCAYPKIRWLRDASPAFAGWGPMVGGPRTPWAEWYDAPKLLDVLAPAKFEVLLYEEWSDGQYNWFDLRYLGL